jgi:hypothetical protein
VLVQENWKSLSIVSSGMQDLVSVVLVVSPRTFFNYKHKSFQLFHCIFKALCLGINRWLSIWDIPLAKVLSPETYRAVHSFAVL